MKHILKVKELLWSLEKGENVVKSQKGNVSKITETAHMRTATKGERPPIQNIKLGMAGYNV